jgi:hypothetical protein
MYVCTHLFIYNFFNTYVCIFMYMYVYMYIHMCMYIFICTYIEREVYIHINIHICIYIRINMNMYKISLDMYSIFYIPLTESQHREDLYKCILFYYFRYIYVYIYIYICIYIYVYIFIYTYVHLFELCIYPYEVMLLFRAN